MFRIRNALNVKGQQQEMFRLLPVCHYCRLETFIAGPASASSEGIWCLLLLLANTALTVTATIITAINVAATNNTTVAAIVHTITNAKTKHPGRRWWNNQTHQLRTTTKLHVFGLWEEAGVPKETHTGTCKRHTERP
ncbi:hypothetical protein Q5P01_016036 [Channa striata]|uniref:Uncharacterized protein n=1 Tax=Channa striata TaxID=64152 RepID=A0AA88MFW2_CHASR|nr:hypothetical protein Q5P01_016036 [Channa striata]